MCSTNVLEKHNENSSGIQKTKSITGWNMTRITCCKLDRELTKIYGETFCVFLSTSVSSKDKVQNSWQLIGRTNNCEHNLCHSFWFRADIKWQKPICSNIMQSLPTMIVVSLPILSDKTELFLFYLSLQTGLCKVRQSASTFWCSSLRLCGGFCSRAMWRVLLSNLEIIW